MKLVAFTKNINSCTMSFILVGCTRCTLHLNVKLAYIFVLIRFLVMFLQTQMQIESALTQDPTVYEYDSVYDDLHPKEQKKVTKPEDRKVSRFY